MLNDPSPPVLSEESGDLVYELVSRDSDGGVGGGGGVGVGGVDRGHNRPLIYGVFIETPRDWLPYNSGGLRES